MKKKFSLAMALLFTSFPLLADAPAKSQWKRSDDPCPAGTHEVVIKETSQLIELQNGKRTPLQIVETYKVCRDNQGTNVREN